MSVNNNIILVIALVAPLSCSFEISLSFFIAVVITIIAVDINIIEPPALSALPPAKLVIFNNTANDNIIGTNALIPLFIVTVSKLDRLFNDFASIRIDMAIAIIDVNDAKLTPDTILLIIPNATIIVVIVPIDLVREPGFILSMSFKDFINILMLIAININVPPPVNIVGVNLLMSDDKPVNPTINIPKAATFFITLDVFNPSIIFSADANISIEAATDVIDNDGIPIFANLPIALNVADNTVKLNISTSNTLTLSHNLSCGICANKNRDPTSIPIALAIVSNASALTFNANDFKTLPTFSITAPIPLNTDEIVSYKSASFSAILLNAVINLNKPIPSPIVNIDPKFIFPIFSFINEIRFVNMPFILDTASDDFFI